MNTQYINIHKCRNTAGLMKSLHAKHAKSIPITLEKMSDLPMDLACFAWKHKFHINFFFKNIFEVEIGDLDAHGRDLLKSINTCKMMKSGFSSFPHASSSNTEAHRRAPDYRSAPDIHWASKPTSHFFRATLTKIKRIKMTRISNSSP